MTHILNGYLFSSMLEMGRENLYHNVEKINALNVFPVPDGDTGTNMNLTFTSGVNEIKKQPSRKINEVAQNLSKGLLMGARGNSGVILSQIFRGISLYAKDKETLTIKEFAEALKSGTDAAYKAVLKPIEGTILTVAKDTANHAVKIAPKYNDFVAFLENVVEESKKSLKRTPDLLPVLKEVGVVDSGGQGLVCVLEGMLASLKGEALPEETVSYEFLNRKEHVEDEVAVLMQQGLLSEEDILFGFCTEFIIRLKDEHFDESLFKEQLSLYGDSTLVISDQGLVKVHIHAEEVGTVLTLAQKYGEPLTIKVENMREQFRNRAASVEEKNTKEVGFVAVTMGKGITDIFKDLGVDVVIEGGQTMNPSTEDLINAIKQTNANHVFILPNNGNIIMAAKQASELVNEYVTVIPSKHVLQGIQAMVTLDHDKSVTEMEEKMNESLHSLDTMQITKSIRNTTIDDVEVKEGDYIGILNGKITTSKKEMKDVILSLLDKAVNEDHEILSFYYGNDITKEEAEVLLEKIAEHYPNIEVELFNGDQPLYPFLIGLE